MQSDDQLPLEASVTQPRLGGASFSLKHRLYRLLWSLVWGGLGTWSPKPFFRWRAFLLRAFGARIAPTAKVYPGVRVWYPKNLTMRDHACLGPGVDCYCMARIELEEFSLVSQRAVLCAGTHDIDSPDFQLYTLPIIIKRNAWVAAEAFVGPGVIVETNSVLGARAVLFRNSEKSGVYVGNPAKLVRSRAVKE